MNWIKKKQKHSQESKEKFLVQISDLTRSGSIPLSCIFLLSPHVRVENTTPELGAAPYQFQNLNLQIPCTTNHQSYCQFRVEKRSQFCHPAYQLPFFLISLCCLLELGCAEPTSEETIHLRWQRIKAGSLDPGKQHRNTVPLKNLCPA